MMDCTLLERPGKWRAAFAIAILCVAALPAVPLLSQTLPGLKSDGLLPDPAFLRALGSSLRAAIAVAAIAFILGLPSGILAALYDFPGRRLLLALTTLPLITPSFLWAIGWSRLAIWIDPAASGALSWLGPYLVFAALTVPIVTWTSFAAACALTRSQLDAARLAGGELVVLKHAARQVAAPALLAALLGGVITLSDAGPDQIFGAFGAASQILSSFAAQHDYALAARQSLSLAGITLAITAPIAILAAPRIAAAVLSRQALRAARARSRSMAIAGTVVFLSTLMTLVPILGLALPLLGGTEFGRAFTIFQRTFPDTLIYSAGGAAVALVLGFVAAFSVGRDDRLRKFTIAIAITLFSLPPALSALGLVQIGTQAPSWVDPLLRSKATVCAGLGLRFLPVALVLGLRSWATMSPSWALAAGIHGVPVARYVFRVVLLHLAPAAASAFILVALLSMADLTTVLLLHPPGASSLALSIFTVMANAQESLVASLCVTYFGMAVGLLLAGWCLSRVQTS